MSISTATNRRLPPRRVQPRHMAGALVLAIGLIAVVVAIAISSTTSNAGRLTARPVTSHATRSEPAAQPTPVSTAPAGTFRDPVTHALIAVGSPTAPQRESGHGPQ